MFSLKNLFKKTYIDIDISSLYQNKNICVYSDLYTFYHMYSYLAEKKYHYTNIRANKQTVELIESKLDENLFKTKNKYNKLYTFKYLQQMAGMDKLVFAPYIDNTIKNNTIRILFPNNKLYKKPQD